MAPTSLLLLALLAATPPTPAEGELQAAIACFQELDYACAEERLAVALRGTLPPPAQIEARRYDALLALAFQDEARARRAVRAVLALDPAWDPGPDAPPRLAVLLGEERPAPRPAGRLAPALGLLGGATLLAGRDAEQWESGLAGELSGGLLLGPSTRVDLALGYGRHDARSFFLERLALATAVLAGHRRLLGRNPSLGAGGGLGAAWISEQGVTGEQTRWGLIARLSLEANVRFIYGFGLRAELLPTLLTVQDAGKAAFSYLLTLGLGLTWEPGSDEVP